MVVSELITNAMQASTQADVRPRPEQTGTSLPVVYLRLLSDRQRVVIEVWDASPYSPTPRAVGLEEESGRGLMLVDALSTRWSWYPARRWGGGKVVWAELVARREI